MRFWNCEFCEKWGFENVNFWINWGFLPQCGTKSKSYCISKASLEHSKAITSIQLLPWTCLEEDASNPHQSFANVGHHGCVSPQREWHGLLSPCPSSPSTWMEKANPEDQSDHQDRIWTSLERLFFKPGPSISLSRDRSAALLPWSYC